MSNVDQVNVERVPTVPFAEFERAVLQDNIALCDQKSGILLAFGSALVIYCITIIADPFSKEHGFQIDVISMDLLSLLAAVGFLVSCHFSLITVLPRVLRSRDDYVYWGSPLFRLSEDEYIERMHEVEHEHERDDMYRHLHVLARVCRAKFRNFRMALRFALFSFAILIAAELAAHAYLWHEISARL